CSLPKDEGTGNGIQFSFFYVKSEGLCHPFIFKGAGGNENRFQTDQECMRNCSEKHSYPVGREACSLEKDSGICLGRLLKFYYDKELKTCKSFIYGGCQGNGNRFETKEECRETCHG
ncbi:TFPI1 inhibitor, partial [Amia calva]|nr:TFPI1 inhibitor [Amia calva]